MENRGRVNYGENIDDQRKGGSENVWKEERPCWTHVAIASLASSHQATEAPCREVETGLSRT